MGPLSFPSGSVVCVDTQVLIYTVEGAPGYWQTLEPFWNDVQEGLLRVVTSELPILECLVRPLRMNDLGLVQAYEGFFIRPNISLVAITPGILKEAAFLRAQYRWFRTPDAIQIATARLKNASIFLTNDRALKNVPDLNVDLLDDHLHPSQP